MAVSSLFTLLDDIASVLDDVALLTKVAAKKTAGVLGDDLAVNAEQVSGVRAEREIPVVLAVAKGSFINKAILVPSALALSALLPWLITPLLMAGGVYLCFEGVEKLVHKPAAPGQSEAVKAILENRDLMALEREKIRSAIRTDFVLSAEIIVIALGSVQQVAFLTRVCVLSLVAVAMTIGVYGFVAGLVKLDDLGLLLLKNSGKLSQKTGAFLLWATPKLMHLLSLAGTWAMFLVGGGILLHSILPALSLRLEYTHIPFLASLAGITTGLSAGFLALGAVALLGRLKRY